MRTLRSLVTVFVSLLATAQCTVAQQTTYPDDTWAKVQDPEKAGWSSEILQQAREYSQTIDTAGVMIVHKGLVVDEWGETKRKFNVHSVRKSLLSALVGIYVDEGVLDLESTLADLGIDDRLGLTQAERQSRFIDILGSRSGVYHPSNLIGEAHSKNWPERGSHAPGTFWYYSNWDFNAAGAIFEKETGKGIFEAFDQLIAQPLGMQDYTYRDGMYEPRSGFGGAQGRSVSDFPAYVFRLTARDMARFGLLYLRKGRWNQKQIIPKDWVERTTRSERPISEYSGHEFYWWTSIDGKPMYPDANTGEGAYAAHGAGGHRITIMPSYDLVVVHRVNTNDRTVPVGGVDPGTSVSSAEYGKLLALILEARKQ